MGFYFLLGGLHWAIKKSHTIYFDQVGLGPFTYQLNTSPADYFTS